MTTVVNAAIIQDGKILMVRKNQVWIFPGGKMEPGESDLEILTREVSEELSGTKLKNEQFFTSIEGITRYSKRFLKLEPT